MHDMYLAVVSVSFVVGALTGVRLTKVQPRDERDPVKELQTIVAVMRTLNRHSKVEQRKKRPRKK